MSIVTANGQPATPSDSAAPEQQQRVQLTPQQAQQIIGAYSRLKELNSNVVANPRDDAEKQGLINFLNGAFMAHAEEFFGCWVVVNQEYNPLITGFTSLLRRALTRIDAAARQENQAATVTEEASAK